MSNDNMSFSSNSFYGNLTRTMIGTSQQTLKYNWYIEEITETGKFMYQEQNTLTKPNNKNRIKH